MESLESVRALVSSGRPQSWNLGYPVAVRARVAAYTAARRAAGLTHSAIAEELGLSRTSVVGWSKVPTPSPRSRLRRVDLVDATDVPAQAVLREAFAVPTPAVVGFALVSPRGFRAEGLSIDALAALLERLG